MCFHFVILPLFFRYLFDSPRRNRKGIKLIGTEEQGGVGRGEIVIRMNCKKKNLLSIKKNIYDGKFNVSVAIIKKKKP